LDPATVTVGWGAAGIARVSDEVDAPDGVEEAMISIIAHRLSRIDHQLDQLPGLSDKSLESTTTIRPFR
jgi:hypothetical protein